MLTYNQANIEQLAEAIVDSMDMDTLVQYVYEDLIHIMEQDESIFSANAEFYDWMEDATP